MIVTTTDGNRLIFTVKVKDAMQSVLKTKDAAEWDKILHDAGVPAGLVLNVDKTRRLDQIITRGMVKTLLRTITGNHKTNFFHMLILLFYDYTTSYFVSGFNAAIQTISLYSPSMQTSSHNNPSRKNPAFS